MKFIYVTMLLVIFLSSCKEQQQSDLPIKEEKISITKRKLPKINIQCGINFNDYKVIDDEIRRGDSFIEILSEYNISRKKIYEIVRSVGSSNIKKIHPGEKIILLFDKDTLKKSIKKILYQGDITETNIIHIEDSIIRYETYKHPTTKKMKTYSGIINTSLWETMLEKEVDPGIINQMSNIYAWTVDFFHLFKGDSFKILVEEEYVDDTIYTNNFEIKASLFKFHDDMLYAFKYKPPKGNVGFYSEKGESLQRPFLKAPIEYSRISSRYSKKRYHPVLKRWKSHKGTDYAAPRGTPIKATADGIVIKSSYSSGNGKYVKIKHNSVYETQYLHMSRRAVRKGQKVVQGQIIGYVGSTGLATGPHICYRFWKNGKQVDPYKQKLPKSAPLKPEYLKDFITFSSKLKQRIDSIPY